MLLRRIQTPRCCAILKHTGSCCTRCISGKLVVFDADDSANAALGIFSVRKKDGSLRIIFDTRLLKLQFIDPLSVQLPTAGALCNMEVADGQELEVAACDVSTASYRM